MMTAGMSYDVAIFERLGTRQSGGGVRADLRLPKVCLLRRANGGVTVVVEYGKVDWKLETATVSSSWMLNWKPPLPSTRMVCLLPEPIQTPIDIGSP